MSTIRQEFYCMECQGYFLANLNVSINLQVEIICPNCGHKHHRYIKDGQIFERGRENGSPIQEIHVPKCTYSKKPLTEKMQKATTFNDRRDGVPLPFEESFKEAYRDEHFKQRWLEKAANEKDGGE